MEIVVPLLGLAGMYVISNQSNKNSASARQEIQQSRQQQQQQQRAATGKENFVNMGARTNLGGIQTGNYLPNTNIPPQNYPVSNVNQLVDTINNYPNPNIATDKYFDQNLYENMVNSHIPVSQDPQQIYSLTGDYLNSAQFKHNNMIPFNGGKVKGNAYDINIAETVLDNMVGSGSQTTRKLEQAPLFKPEQSMQWTYGTPNQSDFFQSRVNPATRNANVKPFDTIMVGPGLDQGYGINGSDGYNSGMEARDKWLPKTVDELRVDTNPRLEYELINHEGPANAYIKNASTTSMLGRVEKQRPDTYFINTQDRWLTTTGAEKGETLRPIQEMGIIRRADIATEYMGPAGAIDVKAAYAPENFEPSKRHESLAGNINHSTAVGRGPTDEAHISKRAYTNYDNHRTTVRQPDTIRSGFSAAVGAAIAPIMDIFRPTRKSETIYNVRVYGEPTGGVPKGPVYNPNDTTATTVKETTLYAPTFNINNQREGVYVNNYSAPNNTQRDSTSSEYFTAPGGYATGYGDMNYGAAYNQHNNDIKSQTIGNRANQGGMSLSNQSITLATCRDDCDRFEGRMNPAYSRLSGMPPSVQTYGAIHVPQYNDQCAGCDRINPDILTAFKENPYTHSLTTAV